MRYGINGTYLHFLWDLDKSEGRSGLLKRKYNRVDFALKKGIALDIEKKILNFARSFAKVWSLPSKNICMVKTNRGNGFAPLRGIKRQGRY